MRETEPMRPSNRLSGMTGGGFDKDGEAACEMEAKKLCRALLGIWIGCVMFEKDRTRRYETANGLAQDIGRYLNNEPISAAARGRSYRVLQLVRRE